LTMQNWPCALAPKYWSPTRVAPHFTPLTTKRSSPSLTCSPILASFGLADSSGAGLSDAG
jgi:hypothetical protein